MATARSPTKACNAPAGWGFRPARQRLPRRRLQSACSERGHCRVRPPRADWFPARELRGDWLERSGRWWRHAEGGCVGAAAVGQRAGASPRSPPRWPPSAAATRSPAHGTCPCPPARGGWGSALLEPRWPRPDGLSAPRPPGSARSPSGMEVLDEFDSEFPQSVTFCQLISEEDFERQAATYTERALRRLFRSIDRNPALAERVVRKGKLAEYEGRGLLSFFWVRAGRRASEGGGAVGGAHTAPARCPLGRSSEDTLGAGRGRCLGGEDPFGPSWSGRVGSSRSPRGPRLGSAAGRRLTCLAPSCPASPLVAGEVLLCSSGGAELLQQHGCPGDAPAPGAAEEEHAPRAPLLPG